jgi:hypothetical protein
MSVVLYGSTSSIIVDVEETCARLGLTIAAIVKNVASEDFALSGAPTMAPDEVPASFKSLPFAIPIFGPAHRRHASEDARRRGFERAATLVDPTAIVAASTKVGPGSYVNCGAIIGGAARIGAFVFVNRGANIGHHADLADFVSIGPGAHIAGGVRLGRGAVVSTGAVILPKIAIGSNSVIGAGSVVTKSVPDRCLVVGNPGRVVVSDYAGYQNMSV